MYRYAMANKQSQIDRVKGFVNRVSHVEQPSFVKDLVSRVSKIEQPPFMKDVVSHVSHEVQEAMESLSSPGWRRPRNTKGDYESASDACMNACSKEVQVSPSYDYDGRATSPPMPVPIPNLLAAPARSGAQLLSSLPAKASSLTRQQGSLQNDPAVHTAQMCAAYCARFHAPTNCLYTRL